MTQTCFVSDKEFDQLGDGEFAQPYQEGGGDIDNRTLYPVPKRAMKYIGIHNPAGEKIRVFLTMCNCFKTIPVLG